MGDLENKKLMKIMWLPGELSIVWNMKDESNVDTSSDVYERIRKHLNLDQWINDYENLYNKWLNEDSTMIHDLHSNINERIRIAIKEINAEPGANSLVFYWYDKDRTFEDEDFLWTKSPISEDILIDLGEDYHYLNRLISLRDYLVFPKYPRKPN